MEQIIRLPAVLARTGLGKTTLYARIADGRFPKPVPISDRAVGWLASEVDTWIAAQVSAARAEPLVASA